MKVSLRPAHLLVFVIAVIVAIPAVALLSVPSGKGSPVLRIKLPSPEYYLAEASGETVVEALGEGERNLEAEDNLVDVSFPSGQKRSVASAGRIAPRSPVESEDNSELTDLISNGRSKAIVPPDLRSISGADEGIRLSPATERPQPRLAAPRPIAQIPTPRVISPAIAIEQRLESKLPEKTSKEERRPSSSVSKTDAAIEALRDVRPR